MAAKKLLMVAALACACGFTTDVLARSSMNGAVAAPRNFRPHSSEGDLAGSYSAGVTALEAQNYADAIRQFRIAEGAAPHNGTVSYALALSYLGANDKTQARDALRRSIQDTNAPVDAHLRLALISLELGDRDTAVAQQAWAQRALGACNNNCGEAQQTMLTAAYARITHALTPATTEQH